jgi:hypothetical protein
LFPVLYLKESCICYVQNAVAYELVMCSVRSLFSGWFMMICWTCHQADDLENLFTSLYSEYVTGSECENMCYWECFQPVVSVWSYYFMFCVFFKLILFQIIFPKDLQNILVIFLEILW